MDAANLRSVQTICQRYQAIILDCNASRLHVAVSETPTQQMIEALRFASQCHVEIECWPRARIEQYSLQPSPAGMARESSPDDAAGASAVERVQQTLLLALQRRASDIHFEPHATGLRIRLRIDGVLHPVTGGDDPAHAPVIARLKILGREFR
ncbi:ATPase, T2SS/T4P/T4SS family [Erwinia sp. V71]|uniref:ATPase, T2SS/T4P/T4SS family n=1 Tax=Erwinia sp. V71 TaxID=3369424 RepID=UPI003F636287